MEVDEEGGAGDQGDAGAHWGSEESVGVSGVGFQRLTGDRRLRLGANALRQLEVVSGLDELGFTAGTGGAGGGGGAGAGAGEGLKGSLLHLLDRTRTAVGARVLRRWLLEPLAERRAIQQRLGAVELLRDAVSGGSGEWFFGV